MKRFLKQIALLVLVVVAIATLRNHAPTILPMPAQQYVHGAKVQIPVAISVPRQTGTPSWSLAQMKNHKYEVFVHYKGQLKGKFEAAKQTSSSSAGKDFAAVGKVEFGTKMFNAATIHVNPDGRTGYIVFLKSSAKPPGT